ncbi:hypothetical protein HMPREF0650_0388, partial [Hoylesella buccalis ATCC 35310]
MQKQRKPNIEKVYFLYWGAAYFMQNNNFFLTSPKNSGKNLKVDLTF